MELTATGIAADSHSVPYYSVQNLNPLQRYKFSFWVFSLAGIVINSVINIAGFQGVRGLGTLLLGSENCTCCLVSLEIPPAHCVRGGMTDRRRSKKGKRRAADGGAPLPGTFSPPPFFFPCTSLARHRHSVRRESVERNLRPLTIYS